MASAFVVTRRLLAPQKGPIGPQSVAEALRRNELSRRQIGRRKEKEKQKYRHDYKRDRIAERQSQVKLLNESKKDARKRRKEDYELGPLAPRRDVGEFEQTYGTANPRITQGVDVAEWEQKWCPFEVGDRVVLKKGRDKGKIGVIDEVNKGTQTLRIKDLNMVDLVVPKWLDPQAAATNPVRAYNRPIPIDSVRLVFPMPHPVTGEERDVIIENLVQKVDWYDESTNTTHYKRVVPELDDYEIPSPQNDEPMYNDHEDDTLRISAEHVTFEGQAIPLLTPPMPNSVIDELRNKYSRLSHRRLKDPEYLEKLRGREEANERKKLEMLVAMRTPLQELHALHAAQKPATEDAGDTEIGKKYLDIREDKPWTRKHTYDAKKAWKKAWNEEQEAAKAEGRKAKKPPKDPRKQEPFDEGFLEQLGALMVERGLHGSSKASKTPAMA